MAKEVSKEIVVGELRYRIKAVAREGRWVAAAERAQTGERFGVECTGDTDAVATERMAGWLDWQHQHSVALEALQRAERAYHRNLAANTLASWPDERSLEAQREALEAVDRARLRLDAIRAHRPL
ncbi:MAG: hypothetical protein DMF89_22710 [Acidobacteria bacterium]|nr:MAG: hypothetical protein DMF89_22710 [Acidobacteriota bacterium]